MPREMSLGIFESHGDVGEVGHAGSVSFDASTGIYTVTGSGENLWREKDAFQFAWKTVSGDVALTANIAFPNPGVDAHRKAVLMIRQSLEPGSAYVDVALHGDGLTSLQFREAAGADTQEVQSAQSAPARVCIEKRGDYVLLFVGDRNGDLQFSGAATRIRFDGPFLVGIGVCSHNDDVLETAVFPNLELVTDLSKSSAPVLYSTLETQVIASTDRRVSYVAATHIEAPNWLSDGETLIVNRGGRLLWIPVAGGDLETIDTGFAVRCNNDHGVSPDGTQLVISDQSGETGKSLIYTLPVGGGEPTLITPIGPSYWHGWSPDGATLTFCGQRDGKYGIFTIPADGSGPETRLTITDGLDDGPEYSPDGAFIYFNSYRTGRMQIWRVKNDGSDPQPVTSDDYSNWFAHPSPDGRFLTILSYEKEVAGHPANKDVTLRLLTLATREIMVLARLFGGQGTINVPCWSPDSRRIAFVSYQLV